MVNKRYNLYEEIESGKQLEECRGGIIPPCDWILLKFTELSIWAQEKLDNWIKSKL